MFSFKPLFAIFIGFLTVITKAMPVSHVTVNDLSNLSKDWSGVFAPGISMVSSIESGASMASITFVDSAMPWTGIQGYVYNKCPFPVYARLAVNYKTSADDRGEHVCEHHGEYPEEEVQTGRGFRAPFKAQMDQCGFVIKVARNRGDFEVYQVEYSGDDHDGRMWYNLSAEDGAPFQDTERHLTAHDCPLVHCSPGQYGQDPVHGCDWPIQPVCNKLGPIIAVMCGTTSW